MSGFSEAEENALAVYYPIHGSSWPGWDEVLPGRTKKQIRNAAWRRNIRSRADEYREAHAVADELPPRNSSEGIVSSLLGLGMTPSAIDSRQKWVPGTAARIAALVWRRDQARKRNKPHPRATRERERMATALGVTT